MGTGWNLDGQRCGLCHATAPRMARCTCTGNPPSGGRRAGDASLTAAIGAEQPSGMLHEGDWRRMNDGLAASGYAATPMPGSNRVEVPLNRGWLAYVEPPAPLDRFSTVDLHHPESGRRQQIVVHRPTPERLAKSFDTVTEEPSTKPPAPTGVDSWVWDQAGPLAYRENPDDRHEAALWTSSEDPADWAERGAKIHDWIQANADSVPRESMVALANQHLMSVGGIVDADAGLFRCRNEEYVGETTIADQGDIAFYTVTDPDPDDFEDDYAVVVQSVRTGAQTRYRGTTFPYGEVIEAMPAF